MSKELVISSNRHETKVAILEDDQLVEIYFQRANEYSLAGSVHKGRVTRVLPGMQSAFVDLGLERDTFLYVSDFLEENGDDIDRITEDRPSRPERHVAPPAAPRAEVEEPTPPAHSEEPEAVAEVQAVASPAGAGREETSDSQDRRGRRSRRRRNRGRGFPESKYAPASQEPEEEAPPSAAESVRSAEPSDFAVLPGESLAKYRNTDVEEAEDTGSEEADDSIEDADTDDGVQDADELDELPRENAIPDAPEHEHAGDEESEPEESTEEAEAEEAESEEPEPDAVDESSAGMDADIPEREPESEEAENDESESAEADQDIEVETPSEDDEDPEIQALILERDAGDLEQAAAPESPLTANVRETGSRYLHRGSRRMRRRRGGEQTAAPAAAPRPEARSEPRPAARTDSRAAPRLEKPASTQSISDVLKEGQEILVQIAKEPLGQKGARITSHIALPGRYVVYMPTLDHMGVSRKIASDDERLRLKKVLQKHRVGLSGGFIIRTAGEGKTEEEIAADMTFLANLWIDIRQKAEKRKAPMLLHHDLDIVQRVLRDQVNEGFKSVWVDSEELYENILRFLQRFQPSVVSRVKLYTRSAPIFDAFNVTTELEKALRPKVWLKSGGYIVINQTEALVAIDVNTGKYVGKSNRLEDTIVKTNTEAVKEIVRQVRLRDLGGIIVIDFIDMDERKNRQKVMQALEDAMRADRAPYKILQFNDFGLVAITRKRVKQSLERTLCSPCPYCEGAGYVKSVQTLIGEMLQEAQKIARAVEGQNVMLRVHPDVAKVLKSNQNRYLEELEEILGRPVMVSSDPMLHHEKFDLV